ncbi:hypothetical protein M3Y95_00780400 [Aphelenchoides besseyi]|nr:hypothetical protein M3Y95_00780400 [Aphelenchoides besseyi]
MKTFGFVLLLVVYVVAVKLDCRDLRSGCLRARHLCKNVERSDELRVKCPMTCGYCNEEKSSEIGTSDEHNDPADTSQQKDEDVNTSDSNETPTVKKSEEDSEFVSSTAQPQETSREETDSVETTTFAELEEDRETTKSSKKTNRRLNKLKEKSPSKEDDQWKFDSTTITPQSDEQTTENSELSEEEKTSTETPVLAAKLKVVEITSKSIENLNEKERRAQHEEESEERQDSTPSEETKNDLKKKLIVKAEKTSKAARKMKKENSDVSRSSEIDAISEVYEDTTTPNFEFTSTMSTAETSESFESTDSYDFSTTTEESMFDAESSITRSFDSEESDDTPTKKKLNRGRQFLNDRHVDLDDSEELETSTFASSPLIIAHVKKPKSSVKSEARQSVETSESIESTTEASDQKSSDELIDDRPLDDDVEDNSIAESSEAPEQKSKLSKIDAVRAIMNQSKKKIGLMDMRDEQPNDDQTRLSIE